MSEIERIEAEKRELERLEDLVKSAKILVDRAQERLSIDTANHWRLRSLATDSRILLDAAVAVLARI